MKILLPTDFSENSFNAISYAMELIGSGHEWTILHCYNTPHAGASMMVRIDDILAEQSKQDLTAFEEKMKGSFDQELFPTAFLSEHGEVLPVTDIMAKRDGYDLIAMGTTGASGLKEVLFGSVASKVIENSKLPVLAVPAAAKFSSLNKIAVADDRKSVKNKDAAWIALELIDAHNPQVLMVTVSSSGDSAYEGNDAGIDGLFSSTKRSYHVIEHNDVSEGLQIFNKQNDIDMLVMHHRKESDFIEWLTVSTSEEMAMHAHTPLLVIKD